MAEEVKKFYWLKLQKDFFKRHDIKIIESMQNGKDYILFYLKLLCESVSHEGYLRFSDEIPYDENMLSVITNTNIDIVRSAIQIFTKLNMMELLDDGTYFFNEVQRLIGSETEWAVKKREYRAKIDNQLQIEDTKKTNEGQEKTMSDKSKSIEIDNRDKIIKENNITDSNIKESSPKSRISKPTTRFIPPTIDEIKAYCDERNNLVDAERFYDFYESKGWMVGKNKMKEWKAAVRTWEKDAGFKPSPTSSDDRFTYDVLFIDGNNVVRKLDNGWEMAGDRPILTKQQYECYLGVKSDTVKCQALLKSIYEKESKW